MLNRILFLFFFLPGLAIFATPVIDLVKDCPGEKTEKCQNHSWFYKKGFSKDYLNLTEPTTDWKQTKFPITINQLDPQEEDLVTYSFFTNFSLNEAILSNHRQPGLRIAYIGQVFSVYINGQLIEQQGRVEGREIVHPRMVRDLIVEIPRQLLRNRNNCLLIKVDGDPKFSGSGFYLQTGYEVGIYKEFLEQSSDPVGMVLTWFYLAVGLYHLLLFILRREEKYNLHFAIFSIFIFVYFLSRSDFIFNYRTINNSFTDRLERISLFGVIPMMYIFHESLLLNHISRFTRLYTSFCLLLAMITVVLPLYLVDTVLRTWQVSALLTIFYLIFVLIRSVLRKNKDAMFLLIGVLSLIFAGIFDILDSLFFHTGVLISRYAFFAFVMGIVAMLANRFNNLYATVEGLNRNLKEKIDTIEDLNASLERKVEERTHELQETLNEVQILKEKQDGDYFLTTLIIRPLMSNTVGRKNVQVEFLLKQKKEFQFRKKNHEIGGDICIADSIAIGSKTYTIFINGDAMGKSIQGAGGAIVLGVVFKSVVSRTKLFDDSQVNSPEKWLKSAFVELQNVFESFDGSMLISVVMGILDDATGYLYFINAEHPWVALYRDGKASFIEEELHLHKIGISGFETSLKIQTFQMQHGDILFSGSDGRDDVQLSEEEGIRLINEDETLFLNHLEQGKGDPQKVLAITSAVGELTDDFSLLKISYQLPEIVQEKEDWQQVQMFISEGKALYRKKKLKEAVEKFAQAYQWQPDNNILFAILIRLYRKIGDYENLAKLHLQLSEKQPWRVEGFQIAFEYCYLAGKFVSCLQIAERLKIRDPENLDNLLLLARAYYLNNYWRQLKKYIDRILTMDEQNPQALLLQREIPRNFFD